MQHKSLIFARLDDVLSLGVLSSAESGDADGLCFAASEERAAVRSRKNARFARDRTNHRRRSAVLTAAFVSDVVAKGARFNLAARVDDGGSLRRVHKEPGQSPRALREKQEIYNACKGRVQKYSAATPRWAGRPFEAFTFIYALAVEPRPTSSREKRW